MESMFIIFKRANSNWYFWIVVNYVCFVIFSNLVVAYWLWDSLDKSNTTLACFCDINMFLSQNRKNPPSHRFEDLHCSLGLISWKVEQEKNPFDFVYIIYLSGNMVERYVSMILTLHSGWITEASFLKSHSSTLQNSKVFQTVLRLHNSSLSVVVKQEVTAASCS